MADSNDAVVNAMPVVVDLRGEVEVIDSSQSVINNTTTSVDESEPREETPRIQEGLRAMERFYPQTRPFGPPSLHLDLTGERGFSVLRSPPAPNILFDEELAYNIAAAQNVEIQPPFPCHPDGTPITFALSLIHI